MVTNRQLQLKSLNSIITLNLEDYDLGDCLEKIDEKFSKNSIYDGFVINSIKSDTLTEEEIDKVKHYLSRQYNIIYKEKITNPPPERKDYQRDNIIDINIDNSTKSANNAAKKVKIQKTKGESIPKNIVLEDTPTKIIKNTIRSGNQIVYEGNIVIIGDLNPGAKVMATGDIIIIGSLRGFAQAGINGNSKAMILAHSIKVTQLSIDTVIAIMPKEFDGKTCAYYVATIENDEIIIESKK